MIKNFILGILAAFVLSACANKDTFSQVNQISRTMQCYACDSEQGFEAKIKGLYYVSDIGIHCCANKRTLDSAVALKKVYLHRFYDLREEKKTLYSGGQRYLIDMNFNAVFYVYLKQELEARGIEVLEKNPDSPYVSKVSLSFIDFSSKTDPTGLHSRVAGVLNVKDINLDKDYTIRTKQNVKGFENLKEITFYTHLLLKQMANKAASLISEL